MNFKSAVIAAVLTSTLFAPVTLSAQVADSQATGTKTNRWSFQVPSGAILPTGEQRNAIKRGNLTALQLAYLVRSPIAITSTVGWARSRDVATAGDPKLDVFTYDLGAELRGPRMGVDKPVTFNAFAGAGAGGRSYNYRKLDLAATHNLAVYGSAGVEMAYRRAGLRLEARDYLTGFKPLDGIGASRTGNDVVVMVGLRLLSR